MKIEISSLSTRLEPKRECIKSIISVLLKPHLGFETKRCHY